VPTDLLPGDSTQRANASKRHDPRPLKDDSGLNGVIARRRRGLSPAPPPTPVEVPVHVSAFDIDQKEYPRGYAATDRHSTKAQGAPVSGERPTSPFG
jgi:hypothetical protein